MFDKTVDDVLKNASKVIDELDAAASRALKTANTKSDEIAKLQVQVEVSLKEATKGETIANRFRDLITVEE